MNKRNYISVEGNLGKDPTSGLTRNGIAYATFDVGVNNARKNPQTGQWENGTTIWIHIVCYDKLAQLVGNHLKKGILVHVEGHMKENNSNYTNKNGQNVNSQKMDLIAESITIPITYLPKILGAEQPAQPQQNYQSQQTYPNSGRNYPQNTPPVPQPTGYPEAAQEPGPNWSRFGELAERMAERTTQSKQPNNQDTNYSGDPFPQAAPFLQGRKEDIPF